jgi:membrane protease YdiL (CAAX protease family)
MNMKKKASSFVIWTFIISYLYAALFYFILGIRSGSGYLAMAVGYMWIPGIIAIIHWRIEKRSFRSWGLLVKPNRWFVFAWLVFLALQFVNIPITLLWPGTSFSLYMSGFFSQYEAVMPPEELEAMRQQATQTPWLPMLMMVVQSLAAAVTINLLASLGEELGWRGYLHEKLISLGFWKCSLLTGTIWGLWHAPLILQGHNYPDFPQLGVLLMTVWCILLAPLFTLIRLKSGSVIAASIAHGSLNASIGISLVYIVGGHSLWNGFHHISGFILLALVNLVIWKTGIYRHRVVGKAQSFFADTVSVK